MKKLFLPLVFIFLLISCKSKTESESEMQMRIDHESVKAKETISENNRQVGKWYKAKQIDSVLNDMAGNIIQFAPNNKPLMGKDSIKNYWNQLFQFGDIDFSLHTQEVKANGPMAIEWGKYELKFTPNEKSPIPAFSDSGNYLTYWQKINNSWKAVWDAPVSSLPLPIK